MNNDLNTIDERDTDRREAQAHRDSITGAPGSHPLGTGLGAVVGGAAAGAATGTVAGPVGTVIGTAVGAVVGGLAGKGVAEAIDPTVEDAYWRQNFTDRAYVEDGSSYDDYRPAYGVGVSSFGRYPGRSFEDVEPQIADNWTSNRGNSRLGWNQARPAARDAWNRLSGST